MLKNSKNSNENMNVEQVTDRDEILKALKNA